LFVCLQLLPVALRAESFEPLLVALAYYLIALSECAQKKWKKKVGKKLSKYLSWKMRLHYLQYFFVSINSFKTLRLSS